MPPLIRIWGRDEYKILTENAARGIKSLLQYEENISKRLMLSGDFNSSIKWGSVETNGIEKYWDNVLLV